MDAEWNEEDEDEEQDQEDEQEKDEDVKPMNKKRETNRPNRGPPAGRWMIPGPASRRRSDRLTTLMSEHGN